MLIKVIKKFQPERNYEYDNYNLFGHHSSMEFFLLQRFWQIRQDDLKQPCKDKKMAPLVSIDITWMGLTYINFIFILDILDIF